MRQLVTHQVLHPSPGAPHSVGAAEEAQAGGPRHGGGRLAWGQQHVGGSPGRPQLVEEVGLRLCPPGRVWRADHLGEEHETLLSGPELLRLQTQLQLAGHAAQKETHPPLHLCRLQPSSQLRLCVHPPALKLLFRPGKLTGNTDGGGGLRSRVSPGRRHLRSRGDAGRLLRGLGEHLGVCAGELSPPPPQSSPNPSPSSLIACSFTTGSSVRLEEPRRCCTRLHVHGLRSHGNRSDGMTTKKKSKRNKPAAVCRVWTRRAASWVE